MGKQCHGKKKNGARCPNAAGESGYCFTHDPARVTDRQAARLKGGFNRRVARVSAGSDAPKIETPADILKLLNSTIADSWILENSPARSRVLLACCDVSIKVLQAGNVEERLSAIEAALKITDSHEQGVTDK